MSLERTALRIATVMALANGYAEPYATIAANRVFDSRMDPIEGIDKGQLAPMVLVYTDTDDGDGLSANNGGPPFRRTVHLVFEISIGMAGEMLEDGSVPLLPITTEPELEAMLDLFEMQIERVFRHPPNTWAARLFAHHLVRIEEWKSSRFVERDAKVRLAARQIVATVLLPQPPEPEIVTATPEDPAPIPEPLGSLLQAVVDADGPYAASAAALAEMIATHGGFGPIVLPDLLRVRLIEARQAELDEDDVARGPRPDGTAQANLTT